MKSIDFVRDQSPFDCLSQADLDQVAQTLSEVHFTRNSQILVRDGSPSQFLYLIRTGAVRLGHEGQTLQMLEEGELFGYASLISQNSPAFDVVVIAVN